MADLHDFELTERAESNLALAISIARTVGANEVSPIFLSFAMLCEEQKAFDNDDFRPQEGSESVLWSVLKRDGDPKLVASNLKLAIHDSVRSIRRADIPKPKPNPRSEKSKLNGESSRYGGHLKIPKFPILNRKKSKNLFPTPSTLSLATDGSIPSRPGTPSGRPDVEANGELIKVMEASKNWQNEMGDLYIAPHHLLLSLLENNNVREILKNSNSNPDLVYGSIKDYRKTLKIVSKASGRKLEHLNKYAVNLTAMASAGKIDPVIGRDQEIRRVIRILCRKTKNSPVLLGEPGVGKTAVAEGLAQRIVKKDVPTSLDAKLFSLDMGALIAGASSRGEYEERIKNVLDEVSRSEDAGEHIILFIDELHLIMAGKSQGGNNAGMDAANLLKPALARGQLRCIGATTLAEYREHIEKDGALERRFAQVIISEPTVADAVTILRGIRKSYETYHDVHILDSALVSAVELAHRYLTQRRLPDSAIDLLDEASASARVTRETLPEDLDRLYRERNWIQKDISALEDAQTNEPHGVIERLKDARDDLNKVQLAIDQLDEARKEQINHYDRRVSIRDQISELERKIQEAVTRKSVGVDLPSLRSELDEYQSSLSDLDKNFVFANEGVDIITKESIAIVVERATKIPLQRLLDSDKNNLLRLESQLAEKVIGQPAAVKSVASAIQRARNGLVDETRPIASFLFTGASGTGKTYLSKVLSECLFKSQDSMVRIDASEYSASHSVSRLIGSPPGYVGHDQGGQLTEYVRRNPFSIVLIDEIEKACQEFVTLFLQVLDDGRLTDGQGRLVDFRNTVIIMTSNLGSETLNESDGMYNEEDVLAEVSDAFPVEFLNRIDETIIFQPLSVGDVKRILNLRIKELQILLQKRHLKLILDDSARQLLASQAHIHNMGARPLMRVIQKDIVNPISTLLLQSKIRDGDDVKVCARNGEICVGPGGVDLIDETSPVAGSSAPSSSQARPTSGKAFSLWRKSDRGAGGAVPHGYHNYHT